MTTACVQCCGARGGLSLRRSNEYRTAPDRPTDAAAANPTTVALSDGRRRRCRLRACRRMKTRGGNLVLLIIHYYRARELNVLKRLLNERKNVSAKTANRILFLFFFFFCVKFLPKRKRRRGVNFCFFFFQI